MYIYIFFLEWKYPFLFHTYLFFNFWSEDSVSYFEWYFSCFFFDNLARKKNWKLSTKLSHRIFVKWIFSSAFLWFKRRELQYRYQSVRILCKESRNPCNNRRSNSRNSNNSNRISSRSLCARRWRENCAARCDATHPRDGDAPARNARPMCSAIRRTIPLPPPWMGWDRKSVIVLNRLNNWNQNL